jgi:hypothetical protein
MSLSVKILQIQKEMRMSQSATSVASVTKEETDSLLEKVMSPLTKILQIE